MVAQDAGFKANMAKFPIVPTSATIGGTKTASGPATITGTPASASARCRVCDDIIAGRGG